MLFSLLPQPPSDRTLWTPSNGSAWRWAYKSTVQRVFASPSCLPALGVALLPQILWQWLWGVSPYRWWTPSLTWGLCSTQSIGLLGLGQCGLRQLLGPYGPCGARLLPKGSLVKTPSCASFAPRSSLLLPMEGGSGVPSTCLFLLPRLSLHLQHSRSRTSSSAFSLEPIGTRLAGS